MPLAQNEHLRINKKIFSLTVCRVRVTTMSVSIARFEFIKCTTQQTNKAQTSQDYTTICNTERFKNSFINRLSFNYNLPISN